ncbi:MAG: GxxExxY protein [Spirochaetes bacterium]|nr:GxxExxY protein [Spirochaetota bacterium]
MDTDVHGLLFENETHLIIGCAMEVLNVLGHGLLEKPYENALCIEFSARNIRFSQQQRYDVVYKTIKVGEYIPDLIVDNQIIVEAKTIDRIGPVEKGQMINYLRIAGLTMGLILNFKHPKLEWKRIIL